MRFKWAAGSAPLWKYDLSSARAEKVKKVPGARSSAKPLFPADHPLSTRSGGQQRGLADDLEDQRERAGNERDIRSWEEVMQLELGKLLVEKNQKCKRQPRVFLSARDVELIEFILDMKFASIENIFQKFFKVLSEGEAKNDMWAKKRLYQLEKVNYLRSVKSFSENTKYYCGTFKGFQAVSDSKLHTVITKPLQQIDQRTFIHDKMVIASRLTLEEKQKVTKWLSDRKLKSSTELNGGLETVYIPDAIYTRSDGQRVAFEVEIAVKAKKRYQDKIKKYVQLMRSHDPKVKIFDRVLFMCAKDSVVEYLKKETKIYSDLFEIKKMIEILGEDK